MSPPTSGGGGGGGSYEMGFQLTPLVDGGLDTSGDFRGGPHPAEDDTLYKMACENRDGGNKLVQAARYEEAIGRYSEAIMQTRALDNEVDIEWTDDGRKTVTMLRATAYLNLSLCFLKTEQWTHASNTATRALQGDKDPADPKDDVLPAEKKAKALFRRAQAQTEGFGNFSKSLEDLRKALEYAPDDKAIQQTLLKTERAVAKVAKEADKKMAGFFTKSKAAKEGDGLFDDSLRPEEGPKAKPVSKEPMKLSDGLWVMPGADEKPPEPAEDKVDFEELSRELNELKEDNPEEYAVLRDKVQEKLKEEIAQMDQADAEQPEEQGVPTAEQAKTESLEHS